MQRRLETTYDSLASLLDIYQIGYHKHPFKIEAFCSKLDGVLQRYSFYFDGEHELFLIEDQSASLRIYCDSIVPADVPSIPDLDVQELDIYKGNTRVASISLLIQGDKG